ncbi:hypothetical protein MAC_08061 [Metarhizium acridum CQMa 102]|uniref:Uncharacterized protein n=1 Tax=Metarhizium acridum (strain CQMa 102) TaxID=655827 RepID=E9EDV6_METAQ|nr:uncharacterized protein MAC_08061 [Metarhizium acridum CQMa 102]EFY85915.1 hypothetical protein MAC_08061 [Metarhizium acridum CQMa 102]
MSKVPGQENMPQGLNESYYRESAVALGMPMDDGSRSRSMPPPTSAVVRYPRSPSVSSSRSSSRSDRGRSCARSYCSVSRDNEHSPDSMNQTRGVIQNNFSQTKAGIGAGIVGAVIGGLVAKQASEAAFRHKQKQSGRPRRHSSETIPRMASTVLGAVAEDYKTGITQMAKGIFLTFMTTTMYTAETGNKMASTQDDVALKNHSSITTETSPPQLVHQAHVLKD